MYLHGEPWRYPVWPCVNGENGAIPERCNHCRTRHRQKIFPLFVLKWNTEKFITFHSGTITPKKRQDCDPDPFSLLIMRLKKGITRGFRRRLPTKQENIFLSGQLFCVNKRGKGALRLAFWLFSIKKRFITERKRIISFRNETHFPQIFFFMNSARISSSPTCPAASR